MSTLLKDRHTLRYGVPNEDGATPTARGERQELPVIIPSSSNSSSSSSLALPSSSSTIPSSSHRNNATRRFAMLPASELDLRSLPPTPQETYSSPLSAVNEDAPPLPSISAPTLLPDHQQAPPPPPTPPPPPPVPKSPGSPSLANGPFPFPSVRGTGGHKRKTSTASQLSQAQSQAQYSRNSYASTTSNFSSSSAGGSSMPPSVPARSPLRRPSAKSTASFSGILKEFDLAPNSPLPLSPTSLYSTTTHGGPNPNYASFGAGGGAPIRPSPERPLPRRPSDASESEASLSSETMLNPNPSFTSFAPTLTPDNASILTATMPFEEGKRNNKRKNALLELLSSERAYAADLALVRDIHIPLSRGLPTPFDPSSQSSLPTIPSQSQNQVSPRSSTHTASSAQTHSSVSTALTSVSAGSTGGVNTADLPMPPETSKVVFGNIDEIAVFADRFSEQLEDALGDIIPGGAGQDRVGKLFLEMIPLMGPLYKAYITKHPTANTQFQSLPPSPALTQYNAQCRKLVAAHSNAWDVPSFLIKPVQRLLKYPLLLGTIYNETPDSHPDKQNLIDAKVKIEEVARMVNEGRRRWEVVKTVLNGNSKANSAANGAGAIATRSGAPKMTRMRSFRTKIKPNGETIDVERDRIELEQWEKRIKESESVVKDVAKQTLEWNQSLETVLKRLKNWNAGFGRVTGLGEAGVEAVGAFGKVVQGLQLLSYEFNKTVQTVYLPQLSLLLRTLSSPRILLAHMHTLRHSHVALLNTPYKTRPPSSLVEASNDYRALRDTLQEELPTFMRLFEKGLAVLLLEFAEWQMRLWREVKERWTSFWIALAIEGEGDESVAGIGSNAAETIKIWKERFCEVEEVLVGFRTLTRPPKSQGTSRPSTSGSIYRQPNGSEASMDPYGRALYQQGSRSLSAHDLMNNPITEEAVTWEAVERELAHRSMSSTPSVHSHHRRGNSAQAESQLAHLMANPMIPGPAFIPSSKDKKKPRDSREPPRSSNSSNRDLREQPRSSNSGNRDSREPPPRSSNSSNRDTRDTRGRQEVPVPKLVEPYTQDRGMALARATSPKPTNPPVSPRDKKKAKDKEKHRSKELDDSASIRGRGDASSLRATSPRPFRRKLTDTLFGSPRSPSHSRTRSQQSNNLSEPDPDFKASRRSSNTSSLEPPSAHSRNAFAPLPPLRVSGNSFASEVPVPFQLDPPPSPLYACTTVCPFKHDRSVTYMSLPMLELDIGDTIQVLYEAGHPREHALPGYVDEGDDCLLAAREESTGRIGWVLASYVIPIQ